MIDGKELIHGDLGVGRIVRVRKSNAEGNVLIIGRGVAVTDKPAHERIGINLHQLDCALSCCHVCQRSADKRSRGQTRADVFGREHQIEMICNAAIGARAVGAEIDSGTGKQAGESAVACRQLTDCLAGSEVLIG